MIKAQTCLILGAGASAPYNLPTAVDLRDLILVDRVPNGAEVAQRYRFFNPINRTPEQGAVAAKNDWHAYLNTTCSRSGLDISDFRNRFYRAKWPSIDKFIQSFPEDFGEIGRLHIAAVLLQCERDQFLDKNWYLQLLEEMVSKGPSDLADGMLSVITFNYDRSFERFFLDAFEGFNMSAGDADTLLARITILHVYGQLGSLGEIPYGSARLEDLDKAASNIDLMRPGSSNPHRKKIGEIVRAADNVCFLGFGFASENLEVFDPSDFLKKRIEATTVGISPHRLAEIRRVFPGIIPFDGKVSELLYNRDIFRPKNTPSTAEVEKPSRIAERPDAWVTEGLRF